MALKHHRYIPYSINNQNTPDSITYTGLERPPITSGRITPVLKDY